MDTLEYEKIILLYLHNRKISKNQLAIFHVLYNEPGGLSFMEIAERMGKRNRSWIGGILSQLAQRIDSIEGIDTNTRKYGTTGWTFLFERSDGNDPANIHVKMRGEFRKIINQHPKLKSVMQEPYERISIYKNGFTL